MLRTACVTVLTVCALTGAACVAVLTYQSVMASPHVLPAVAPSLAPLPGLSEEAVSKVEAEAMAAQDAKDEMADRIAEDANAAAAAQNQAKEADTAARTEMANRQLGPHTLDCASADPSDNYCTYYERNTALVRSGAYRADHEAVCAETGRVLYTEGTCQRPLPH